MATDAEESDTDEHEQQAAPAKRPRTRLVNNDNFRGLDQRRIDKESPAEDAESKETDDAERRARERLKKWQACQVAKGFVDNTINHVLEYYVVAAPTSHSFDDPRSRPFRENAASSRVTEMEDRAVAMAIHNHGLVQSTDLVSQLPGVHPSRAFSYWIGEERTRCLCPPSHEGNISAVAVAATSDGARTRMEDEERKEEAGWTGDRADDSNQQQDFLERAVAEAIKKKGLSALSVDYG